jgi:acyl-CoA reductase-like NAD-dependent aldehyde dehydrogenase
LVLLVGADAIVPPLAAFHNMYNHIISSLFAGNGVVLKMSEFSCFTVERMLRIARKALSDLGHDENLIGDVNGFPPTGKALIASVDKVIFTGSPMVGKLVMEEASKYLTPVVLELGGKDPMVICEDVDVDAVVPVAMRGTFQGSGQNCIGIERILVFESKYDEFVDKAHAAVRVLRQGRPLDDEGNWNDVDLGATVTVPQAEHIQKLVDDAVKRGARLLCGGKKATIDGYGTFFQPTLLADVTPEMAIYREEVFGPVMCIIRVEGDNDIEAERLVNLSRYGLGSNVFSKDIPRAERLGQRIRAGMCNINDVALNYMAQSLPFGGVKDSGFGRFAGIEGLRACCLEKSVTSGRATPLPAALQYPIDKDSMTFIDGMMANFYGTSIAQKTQGVVQMVSMLGLDGVMAQLMG